MNIFEELAFEELQQKQRMSLDEKINYAKGKIVEFVETLGGEDKVFVSFSGGKDSTVLLHLVRSLYPNVKGVFFDTGLEYPEIRDFTKTLDNIEWLKPRKAVNEVWKESGVPTVSKEISNYVHDVRNITEGTTPTKRLNYRQSFSISKKWLFLTDKEFTPYESSHHCCKYFKKLPSDDYVNQTKTYPIVGTMAGESKLRLNSWLRHSCNMFDGKKVQSRPISVWTDADIWEYIERYNLDICELYYKGHKRTGCFLCPFGAHLDKSEKNKFELLKEQHPNQYRALDKLGVKRVLADMGVRIANDEEYMTYMQQRQGEIKEWFAKVERDLKENGETSEYYKYNKYFDTHESKEEK